MQMTITIPDSDTAAAGSRPTPAVLAGGLCKVIDGREVVRSLDLSLPPGACCALMGSNGAGKTTLLRLLALGAAPTRGRLEIFGRPAAIPDASLRLRIGVIGHQSMLYRDLSCLENLLLFGRLYRVDRPRERAEQMLDRVGMAERAEDLVGSLSRGMVQRVAIARAIIHDPDLLLADEPFTGLDSASAARLERCLLDLRGAGKTIVLSDHAVQHALALSDRVVVLRAGAKALDAPSTGLSARDVLNAMEGAR